MQLTLPPKTNFFALRGSLNNSNNNYIVLILINNRILIVVCTLFQRVGKALLLTNSDWQRLSLGKNNAEILLDWYTTDTIKLKFSGKGYKMIKRSTVTTLYLNTSHTQWLFLFKSIMTKVQKQKYLLSSWEGGELYRISKLLISARPLNIYTKRGLRLGRQEVLKKIGKRSA